LQEVRAEVVRVRGERLEDIGRLEVQAEEAQDRIRRQIEAVKAEKATLELQLQDHRARAGALDQVLHRSSGLLCFTSKQGDINDLSFWAPLLPAAHR
jgi:hypothetical protein